MTYPKHLDLPNGTLTYPVFFPDATHAVVRALDARDLEETGLQGLVMNTYHLMKKPGISTVQALGGLHQMSGWQKPILTDSGGFQAWSVIKENPKEGSLTNNGIMIRKQGGGKLQLTPEKSIQLQYKMGADILVCLDECTHVSDPPEVQRRSVDRTVKWAQRCRQTFEQLMQNLPDDQPKPVLLGVVQGGGDFELRRECAERLLEIGFDGYGFGGYPLDEDGNLLTEILQHTRELIPEEFPLHALGVGHPQSVQTLWKIGYQMFDCALPTRDARRGRLYTFTTRGPLQGDWFKIKYINDEEFIRESRPLDENCNCHTCQRYSAGYLHHLFKQNEFSYYRLATIHNLHFMVELEKRLRGSHA